MIVGETETAAKAACDELAALGGGAAARQDTQLPYTALQAALDPAFPFNTNYWNKGVFIDWDPGDPSAVNAIVEAAVKHWREAGMGLQALHLQPLSGGQRRGGEGRSRYHVLRRSQWTPLVHGPYLLA